jgi:hypothetical protein
MATKGRSLVVDGTTESNCVASAALTVRPESADTFAKVRRVVTWAIVALYLASVSHHWYISSDSALYLLLGKSLANGDGYALWGRPHVNVPPAYPAILAAMMRIGLGDMWWLNLGMAVTGLAAMWFGYKLLQEQTSSGLAMLVAITVAVSTEMHQRSVQQLSDVPFMLLVMAGLWCYVRGMKDGSVCLEIGTVALIASCWVRVVGIPLALAAALGLAFEAPQTTRRRAWLNTGGAALGVSVTAVLFYLASRQVRGQLAPASYAHHFATLSQRSMASWLLQPLSNFWDTGSDLARLFTGQKCPPIAALAIFWMPTLLGMCLHLRRRRYVGVFATAGYIGAVLLLRELLSRYLLPVAPLLVMFCFDGVRELLEMISRLRCRATMRRSLGQVAGFQEHKLEAQARVWSWRSLACASGLCASPKHSVVAVCALVFLAMNLPKDLRLIYQLHHPRFEEVCNDGWPSMLEAARFLAEHAPVDERFVSSADGRQLSYLSQLPFLELAKSLTRSTPSEATALTALAEEGVSILVFGPGEAPPYYQVLEDAAQKNGAFHVVFENSRYRVYAPADLFRTTRRSAVLPAPAQLAGSGDRAESGRD